MRKKQAMGPKDLTNEQKERVRACETPEDILALASDEGYELSDEELEGISGGWSCTGFCEPICLPD